MFFDSRNNTGNVLARTVLAALISLPLSAAAQTVAAPAPVAATTPSQNDQGFSLTKESATGLSLSFKPSLAQQDKIVDGVSYKKLTLKKNGGLTQEYGFPQMPFLSRFIAVPEGATVVVTVKSLKSHVVKAVDVMPAPPPQFDSQDTTTLPKKANEEAYATDKSFPPALYQWEEKLKVGGVRTGLLRLYPAQYNPVKHELTVHDRLDVSIEFRNAKTGADAFKRKNKKMENVFLNKKTLQGK